LLDKFANIGQISKFEKLIATIRSREVSHSLNFQRFWKDLASVDELSVLAAASASFNFAASGLSFRTSTCPTTRPATLSLSKSFCSPN
jgi:hypothetical protein